MHNVLGAHLLGDTRGTLTPSRWGEVAHMCPDCGNPPTAFCPTCLGVGLVTSERLDRYQRELDATGV